MSFSQRDGRKERTLNPMAESYWWNKAGFIYSWFEDKNIFVKTARRLMFSHLDHLNLPRDIKVYDAGCGDGKISVKLADRFASVTACDFGEAVLRQAEKHRNKLGLNHLQFERCDLNQSIPHDDDSFDLVTCIHVIMKVKDYKNALKEFYRILKPGGYLVLSCPTSNQSFRSWAINYTKKNGVLKSLWHLAGLMLWTGPYVLLTKRHERKDEWRWSKEELGGVVEPFGFQTHSLHDLPYFHVGYGLGIFIKNKSPDTQDSTHES